MPGENGNWLPVGQAAAHLGISERTLRRQIAAGRLQTLQIRGARHVRVTLPGMSDTLPGDATQVPDSARQETGRRLIVPDIATHAISELRSLVEQERARSAALEAELLSAREAAAMHQERSRNLEEETKRLRTQLALPPTQPEPLPSTDPMEELRAKVEELTRQLQAQPDPEPRSWWQRWQRWRRM